MKLIEEAKIKYPVGTKFIAPDNGNTYTVILDDETYYLSVSEDDCLATVAPGRGEYIYYQGMWAEIVCSPIIDDYNYLIKFLKKHGI